MLTQLVYMSRPRFDVSGPEGRKVLDEIAKTSRTKNAEAGISGVMIVGEDWLSQRLEGDRLAMAPVLKEILADARQDSVQILGMRMIARRHFEGWTVGVSDKPVAEVSINRLADLSADDFVRLASLSNA